jgi:hypothetical protein
MRSASVTESSGRLVTKTPSPFATLADGAVLDALARKSVDSCFVGLRRLVAVPKPASAI